LPLYLGVVSAAIPEDIGVKISWDEGWSLDWLAANSGLKDYAWQQSAIVAVATTNGPVADRAVREMLARPDSHRGDIPEILLVSQTMTKRGDGKRGRALLEEFLEKFPDTPLHAEASLLLATSLMREQSWSVALDSLNQWLKLYPDHPSKVRAEFDRAWVQAQLGQTEEAVTAFRTLAVRHASNPLSLMAQLWLGDHFFNQGDFQRSEQAYSMVSTNRAWASGGVPQKARLLAAEAAIRGQRLGNAKEYLLDLLNDKAAPQELLPSAYFALGNLNMLEITSRRDAGVEGYNDALDAFRRVTLFAKTPLMAAAWGRMAECHFQLGTVNPINYDRATMLFQRVVDHPTADVASRAKAKVGLGMVAEKRAALMSGMAAREVLGEAVNHHLDVLTGKVLRAGEVADSWWVREAGMEAARLFEQMGRWREAVGVYGQLLQSVPESRGVWDARLVRAQARLAGTED
jgi:tetratricopeptide (TPR) repeat protein